jgi:uncharacterized protein (TIGR03435 family)
MSKISSSWGIRSLTALSAAMLLPASILPAQSTAGAEGTTSTVEGISGDLPKFSVAAIRQDKNENHMITVRFSDDGVVFTGVPADFLVQHAFAVEPDRIVGLPTWAKTDQYAIQAKVDDDDVAKWKSLNSQTRKVAFQALLVSRFNFKAHPDLGERLSYSLVIAKNGPKLHMANPSEKYSYGLKALDGSVIGAGAVIMGPGKIAVQGASISTLIRLLSNQTLQYPIYDETGLTGMYDFTLEWTPDNVSPPSDGPAVSLFTALQEQLGLKLEVKKKPVEMIVVDHIERPSEN